MLAFRMLEAVSQHGGGSSQTFTVSGSYIATSSTTVSVPSGAAVGDLLILSLTNGSGSSKAPPAGFTTITSDASGSVSYRVLAAGDSGWTLAALNFVVLTAIRGTLTTPTIDVSSHALYTTGTSVANTPVTPTSPSDAAIMIFQSTYAPLTGALAFTVIEPTGVNGNGGCGNAAEWTQLSSAATFNGDHVSSVSAATTAYPSSATLLTLK